MSNPLKQKSIENPNVKSVDRVVKRKGRLSHKYAAMPP